MRVVVRQPFLSSLGVTTRGATIDLPEVEARQAIMQRQAVRAGPEVAADVASFEVTVLEPVNISGEWTDMAFDDPIHDEGGALDGGVLRLGHGVWDVTTDVTAAGAARLELALALDGTTIRETIGVLGGEHSRASLAVSALQVSGGGQLVLRVRGDGGAVVPGRAFTSISARRVAE